MNYEIHIEDSPPRLIAAIRCVVKQSELSKVIPRCCGEVWNFLKTRPELQPGRHVAVYLDCDITLECGAEVAAPFESTDRIVCSATPGGKVVTTRHIGDYRRLCDANDAIRQWCAANGQQLAGPSWEIYGHWNDDPSQVYTDVYYLLRDGARSA